MCGGGATSTKLRRDWFHRECNARVEDMNQTYFKEDELSAVNVGVFDMKTEGGGDSPMEVKLPLRKASFLNTILLLLVSSP